MLEVEDQEFEVAVHSKYKIKWGDNVNFAIQHV